MINIPLIEINPSHKCNLSCKDCANLCWFQNSIPTLDRWQHTIDSWKDKILPNDISVCGGEPLLNQDLLAYLTALRAAWPRSYIHIKTNGTLLHTLSDQFLHYCSFARIKLNIYFKSKSTAAKQEAWLHENKGLVAQITEPNTGKLWYKPFKFNEDGSLGSWNADPAAAYKVCHCKRCRTIYDDKLFFCAHLHWAWLAKERGYNIWPGTKIDFIRSTSTNDKLAEFLKMEPIPACANCPPNVDPVAVGDTIEQHTPESLKAFKKANCYKAIALHFDSPNRRRVL